MNRGQRHLSLGLGVPTILAVFIILCMCILSVLTYMNAVNNHASWEKEKQHTYAYYEADTKAKQIVKALRNGEDMEVIQKQYKVDIKKDTTNITFQVIMKEKKKLLVTLNENFKILTWKTIRGE